MGINGTMSSAGRVKTNRIPLKTKTEIRAHCRRCNRPTPEATPQSPNAKYRATENRRAYRRKGGCCGCVGINTATAVMSNANARVRPLPRNTKIAETVTHVDRFIE